MDFSIKKAPQNGLETINNECLVVAVPAAPAGKKRPAGHFDAAGDALSAVFSRAADAQAMSLTGSAVTFLAAPAGFKAKTVLAVTVPAKKTPPYRKMLTAVAKALASKNFRSVALVFPVGSGDASVFMTALALSFQEGFYRFDEFKSKKQQKTRLPAVTVYLNELPPKAGVLAKKASALFKGLTLTKDLANRPPNKATPDHLAKAAVSLGKTYGFSVDVMNEKQIAALGMNAFLAVAKGSDVPPRFIVIKHMKGGKKDKPTVIVGKGITFDSGGISLKPGAGMDEMKFDMSGAATVLGLFTAIGEIGLKENVIGVIAACENMPSGKATKPGDIVKTMNGKTVEILNTDAEGRLILCDALTYCERFEPKTVVDMATLTGACVVALGNVHSGLFTRDDEKHEALAASLLSASKESGDTFWRMPTDAEYQALLKSNFADLANIGGRNAGATTAACFLENFTRKYVWAHLDIAGTAWKTGAAKGATGRPLPALFTWLTAEPRKA